MLSIKNIVKQYADYRALDDVSIEVEKGKIFGLLGPNGAGKTSLIRIINQITAPDSGTVFFEGEKLNQKHIEKIGYLPEERGLYKKMQIGEQMLYLAQLKGLSKADATSKIRYWFERMDIKDWFEKKVEDLSKGMQQKVQFIATVLHNPELIILDEPFSGFDPVNAELIKNEIIELNKQGTTIIFSTHRMESVEELCHHIALLNKSKKILDGRVKSIRNEYKSNTFNVEFSGQMPVLDTEKFKLIDTQQLDDLTAIKVKITDPFTANDFLKSVINDINIHKIEEIIPSMNDIFIEKVKHLN